MTMQRLIDLHFNFDVLSLKFQAYEVRVDS